jgi:hypothetical protein
VARRSASTVTRELAGKKQTLYSTRVYASGFFSVFVDPGSARGLFD